MDDPRRVLEEAAQNRTTCEVLVRGGGLVRASVLRVEKADVVLLSPEQRFLGGEDVRVCMVLDTQTYRFDASVIRAGVPVPDRSQDGLLLGFIDNWVTAGDQEAIDRAGRTLDLLTHGGAPVSLLEAPVKLIHLALDGLAFTVPNTFKIVFPERGEVGVRLGLPGQDVVQLTGRVRALSQNDGFLLYDVVFEQVDDADAHREAVEQLANSR